MTRESDKADALRIMQVCAREAKRRFFAQNVFLLDDNGPMSSWMRFFDEELEKFTTLSAQIAAPAEKCPTCDSPRPHLHPAIQEGGEVHKCRDAWHAAPVPVGPSVGRGIKMSDVRVGMKLRELYPSTRPLVTVTEITECGFKYSHQPWSLGSRIGVTEGGEHYGIDGYALYELISETAPGPNTSARAAGDEARKSGDRKPVHGHGSPVDSGVQEAAPVGDRSVIGVASSPVPAAGLRECPFCGGVAKLGEVCHGDWCVECQTCRVSTPLDSDTSRCRALWNTRLSTEKAPA